MRGLRRSGLFTIVLLVVLSSVVVNFTMAKEGPDDIELFEPIDLDLSPVLVKSRPKIESRLGDLMRARALRDLSHSSVSRGDLCLRNRMWAYSGSLINSGNSILLRG